MLSRSTTPTKILFRESSVSKYVVKMSVNSDSDINLTAVNNVARSIGYSSSDFTILTAPGSAQATRVDLSNSFINEEDIDPFTYHPPFTKWDYLKV